MIGAFYPLSISCFGCPSNGGECICVTNGRMTSYAILLIGTSFFAAGAIVPLVTAKSRE